MKKFILAIALVASLSTTLVSCSADDSELQNTTQAETLSDGTILPPVSTPKKP
ncbi:hypothetical protein ACLI09_16750 [Flavobacterium sp. RHBU_24]|uniref:hypothetical protein n=1 Tax=Flavobacterium sp. RHBU_24 TaxID=3391185 RepID=UPI0039848AE4